VRAQTNTIVGKDLDFEKILKDFDACLIAVGTGKEKRLDVPGVESALPAVSFLKRVNLGRRDPIGDRVVIMGGGGVAFDCAFTAKRLGAREVHVVCVEGEANLCASPEDVLQAQAEGVKIHSSWMISKVLNERGKAAGIEYFRISSFEFDERGCLSVRPASRQRETLSANTVISAVGVQPDLKFIEGNHLFRLTLKGTLEVNSKTLSTSVDGVFAAGDVVSGPSTVAQAIGSGRHAAIAIDRYLSGRRSATLGRVSIRGEGHVVTEDATVDYAPHVVAYEEILNVEFFEKKPLQTTDKLPVAASIHSFEEVNKGFGKNEAMIEAKRCFHCGHCTSCECCVKDCPGLILAMSPQGPQVAYSDECWHCGCVESPARAVRFFTNSLST